MKKSTEDRLTDLEIGLAHQQRLCEQLNDVVYDQSKQLLQAHRLISKLETELRELRVQRKEPMPDPFDEKPPHY
jgi:SlyX protein